MGLKAALGLLAVVLLVVLLWGPIFGGGGEPKPSASRPGSIPTATPPADLPAPILLGEAQAATGSPAAGGGGGTYVVKPGDTLGAIAGQLGVPADQQAAWVAEVLRLNGIADARLLQAGVELRLPRTQAAAATATRTPGTPSAATATRTPGTPGAATPTRTATPRPTVTGGAGTYTVAEGDYPFLIAEKLGVPEAQRAAWVDQLMALNNIDPTKLQVGQVLQLPAGTPSGGGTSPTATPTPVP